MKRAALYIIIIIAAAMAATMTSCHSNENNYRMAYDKAVEKHKEGLGADVYNAIQAERVRATTVINGDSVRLLRMYANIYDDSTSVAQPYSIVVAEFKQSFNAKSYRDRLRKEEGFPSYILFGGQDRKYYVVVKGFDDRDVAAAFLKTLDKTMKIQMLVPRAWILARV